MLIVVAVVGGGQTKRMNSWGRSRFLRSALRRLVGGRRVFVRTSVVNGELPEPWSGRGLESPIISDASVDLSVLRLGIRRRT